MSQLNSDSLAQTCGGTEKLLRAKVHSLEHLIGPSTDRIGGRKSSRFCQGRPSTSGFKRLLTPRLVPSSQPLFMPLQRLANNKLLLQAVYPPNKPSLLGRFGNDTFLHSLVSAGSSSPAAAKSPCAMIYIW